MASVVKTDFIASGVDLYVKSFDLAARAVDNFAAKTNNSFANLKTPSLVPPRVDAELNKALIDIKKFEVERLAISKSNSSLALNLKKAETKSFADEAKAQTRTFKSELNEISRSLKSESASTKSSLKDLAGSFGLAFGATALIGSGIKFLKDSTTAAFDAERANRKLSASATEAGLAYSVLADKNREFAKAAGLSETAATSIEAKIAQLATFSGKPQNIDLLNKSFLDLSAAKGINSNQIDVLIGTILSGQDEGLNRLGISDPGQLYKAYAKEIGKTADQLSQFEKVQAATNAVVEKAAIFTGANADKMQSLSGQAEKANATIENLYTNFGQGLTQSLEFREFLSISNAALSSLTTNLQSVKRELGDGKTPRQVAEEDANKTGSRFLDGIKNASGSILGLAAFPVDVFTDGFKTATDRYKEAATGASKRRIEINTQLFTKEQKLTEQQIKDANEQKSQLANKTFATSFQSQIDSFLKPASDGVEKSRVTLNQLNKLQKDFTANIKSFNTSQAELAQKGINTVAKSFYTNSAENALKEFSRNPNFADAQTNLKALDNLKNYIPTEKFESFKDKLSDFISSDLKKANELVKDLGKNSNDLAADLYQRSGAGNPFVSLFSEADASAKKLRETTKGLSNDLIADFNKINNQTNSLKLFSARLDNDFDVSDLRNKAADLRKFGRDPLKPEEQRLDIRDPSKFFSDYIDFYTKKLEAEFTKRGGGATKFNRNADGSFSQSNEKPFISYNSNIFTDKNGKRFTSGFTQTDLRDVIGNVFETIGGGVGKGGTFRRVRGFADLSEKEKLDFVNKDNIGFQNRFSASLDLAANRKALNEQQQAEIDRKVISLSSGMNPNQLTDSQRDRVASALEAEARRREQAESKAQTERTNQTALQTRIAAGIDKLNLVAEKEGFNAVQVLIKDETEAGVEAKKRAKTASAKDTSDYYNPGLYKSGNSLSSF